MAKVKEIEFIHILNKLPEIVTLNMEKDFAGGHYDIFFCALGFEDRCLTIPEQLAKAKDFRCKQSLCFEYSKNVEDNEVNKPRLIRAFQQFADSYEFFQCTEDNFTKYLREYICEFIKSAEKPKIIFDISVCSSKLLLSVMKILLEFDIYLLLVYSEAKTYHPTVEEFEKKREKWTTEEDFGIAHGVGKVIPAPEHPGACKENPNLIVAFLTFKYKETIKRLDRIYNDNDLDFHINISALGSKMQTLGIALFCYVRPDVSIYHAIPKEYDAKGYSEGCKETWQIDFGGLSEIRKILDRVDQFETVKTDI